MAATNRRPRGYIGRRHETLGSDILAVHRILKLPDQLLGAEESRRIAEIDPNAWYPIEWLLDLMERLDQAFGECALLRMGRTIFEISHKEQFVKIARCARDVVYGIDGMYHHANRGVAIGGWKVLRFEAAYAELEKNTPHHCVMEQGILAGALAVVGCPGSVGQTACFRKGAPTCIYAISSSFADARWSGAMPEDAQPARSLQPERKGERTSSTRAGAARGPRVKA
jgi:hypothetical protein